MQYGVVVGCKRRLTVWLTWSRELKVDGKGRYLLVGKACQILLSLPRWRLL
jgi:hypothetical protein